MTEPTDISCDEALRLLAAFLDGELPEDDHGAVDRHLERCRSCFSRTQFERRLKAEVGGLRREDVPAAFEERVRRLLGSFSADGS